MKEMTTIEVRGEEKAIATAVDQLGTGMIGLPVVLFTVDRIMALNKVVEVRKEIDIENVLLQFDFLFPIPSMLVGNIRRMKIATQKSSLLWYNIRIFFNLHLFFSVVGVFFFSFSQSFSLPSNSVGLCLQHRFLLRSFELWLSLS